MIRTWGRRSAPLVLFTAGFLALGSSAASADISIGPVSLPTEGVNLEVGAGSDDAGQGTRSSGASQGSGDSAESTRGQAAQQPQQQEGGVANGNNVEAPVNPAATVCGNGVGVLGDASGDCGEGEVPPEEPPDDGEEPPGDDDTPPDEGGTVPPPGDEPPTQQRVAPEGEEPQQAAEELPFTGPNTGLLAWLALSLLAAGTACVTAASRRIRWNRG